MSGLGAASPLGFLAVAIGAVLGAWLRWLAALALNHLSPTVPLGTLLANVVGGLIIGLAVSFFARHPALDPAWRLLVVTGFLGGLTTFSTFSAESLALLMRGDWPGAAVHSGLHVMGSLAAAAGGFALAERIAR
jgi:CrcB protein